MKFSEKMKTATQSWGGLMALASLLILIIFALFTSTNSGSKLTGRGANVEMEDLREHRGTKNRNIVVKDGQKLVVF